MVLIIYDNYTCLGEIDWIDNLSRCNNNCRNDPSLGRDINVQSEFLSWNLLVTGLSCRTKRTEDVLGYPTVRLRFVTRSLGNDRREIGVWGLPSGGLRTEKTRTLRAHVGLSCRAPDKFTNVYWTDCQRPQRVGSRLKSVRSTRDDVTTVFFKASARQTT